MALVAVDGCTWAGICTSHKSPISVTGVVRGNAPSVKAHGAVVCVHEATVQASCGHTDTIIATGKNNAEGKKLALLGDSTTGSPLIGTITNTSPNTTVSSL